MNAIPTSPHLYLNSYRILALRKPFLAHQSLDQNVSILDMDTEEGFDRSTLLEPWLKDKQGDPAIICTASTTSFQGGIGPHAYTALKHGLVGLVRAAASELGKHGIRVRCVSPHLIITPMAISWMAVVGIEDASATEAIASSTTNLKGVTLIAKHVAEAALFLASDESSFVSGHNLAVDGGFVDNSLATMMQTQTKQ